MPDNGQPAIARSVPDVPRKGVRPLSVLAISYAIMLTGAPTLYNGGPVIVAEPLFGVAALAQAGAPNGPLPQASVAPAVVAPAVAPALVQTPPAAEPAGQDAIVVMSKPRPTKADPLAPLNAEVFGVTMAVDGAITGPTAMAYKRHVPAPVRHALRNFINNLGEPVVSLNYLLQLKPGKSLETLGRLGINSTIGLGGVMDMAKRHPFNLPPRPNGFADTLGYYGVKPGPYFYLPLIGPTTLRDLLGGGVDMAVLPSTVGTPFNKSAFTLPVGMIDAIDYRAEFEDELQKLRAEPRDLYRARRAYYLAKRQAQIDGLHHHPAPAGNAATPAGAGAPTIPSPLPG